MSTPTGHSPLLSQSSIELILSESELFQLSHEKSKELAEKITQLQLQPGEILFHQGDESQHAFLLISGRLKAYSVQSDRSNEHVGWILPGETVGEMGLLSGRPRSLSIKSVQHSTLLRLDSGLINQLPKEAILRFFQSLNLRAHSTIKKFYHNETDPEILTLIPLTKGINIRDFAFHLFENWPAKHPVAFIEEGRVLFSKNDEKEVDFEFPIQKIHLINPKKLAADQISSANADRMIFVADSNNFNFKDLKAIDLASLPGLQDLPKELVLIHPKEIANSTKFIEAIDCVRHFHIRNFHVEDCQRVARFFAGCPTGIALGGGGVRGWVHIGALKALSDFGCPIDAIGGTSAGAIMGALWMISKSHEHFIEIFTRLLKIAGNQLSIANFTFPVVSLLNCRRWNNALKDAYGEALIEDFPIPYHCVSCNFISESQAVHFRGSAWKWIRASSSIPGLFPPLSDGDDLYIDGGVLNNLPVDVMKNYLGPGGRVVAIDISSSAPPSKPYYCPNEVSPFVALRLKKSAALENKILPSLVSTFVKSLMMGAQSKTQANSRAADLLIQPNLGVTDMLSTDQQDYLIKSGYDSAITALQSGQIEL